MRKAVHTILLVEDNPADVLITRRALRECAWEVDLVVVADGEEALSYLRRTSGHSTLHRPDLILLDLNLPRVTGREVLTRIRGLAGMQAVPVVVLTTSQHPDDVRSAYAAGANTYIQKPQDFNRFLEVFQSLQRYWLDTALLPSAGEERSAFAVEESAS